jgi:TIR domain
MSKQPIKLFISHASEDKEAFVKGLAAALNANPKFDVCYDDYSLRLGDSLLESITKGLHSSDYGIVVVSPAFISKRWTSNELNGLFALEAKEHKIILPIWHNVDQEKVLAFNPILADRKAILSSKSLKEIVFAIESATGVSERPKPAEDEAGMEGVLRQVAVVKAALVKECSRIFASPLARQLFPSLRVRMIGGYEVGLSERYDLRKYDHAQKLSEVPEGATLYNVQAKFEISGGGDGFKKKLVRFLCYQDTYADFVCKWISDKDI